MKGSFYLKLVGIDLYSIASVELDNDRPNLFLRMFCRRIEGIPERLDCNRLCILSWCRWIQNRLPHQVWFRENLDCTRINHRLERSFPFEWRSRRNHKRHLLAWP